MAARTPRRALLAAAVALLALACAIAGAAVVAGAAPKRPKPARSAPPPAPYEAGPVLVRFAPSASRGRRAAAVRRHGLRLQGRVGATGYERAATRGGDPRAAAAALAEEPGVVAAQPNFRRRAAAAPNDPLFAKDRQGSLAVLGMPAAWDRAKATTTEVVAVLDSGVDLDHPDLEPQLVAGRDVINADAFPADGYGHGTNVAGIAAARADDGVGMAGVAWGAGIMPVKVLDDEGLGYDDDIAAGMTWAADHGADVLNLSLGGPESSPVLAAATAYARERGAVVVASAGNESSDEPQYPAASPGVLAVAATDWSGEVASLSSHGPWIDLAAPGLQITSAMVSESPGGDWEPGLDGTSFAAPVVAGAALLLKAQNPGWSAEQIENRLRGTAHDAGPPGADTHYGTGIVDPAAALGGTRRPKVTAPIDGDSSLDRARSIVTGQNYTGRIGYEGDQDWFTFTVAERSVVEPGVEAVDPAWTIDDLDGRHMLPVIEVYDSAGQRVDLGAGGEVRPGFDDHDTLAAPGRYYARVRSRGAARAVRDYTFGVTVSSPEGAGSWRFPWHYQEEWPVAEPGIGNSVAIGDVTGDGRGDVLVTTNADYVGYIDNKDHLLVLPSDDAGVLQAPEAYDVGAEDGGWELGVQRSGEMDVTTGDVDGDGRTDAVVAAGRHIGIIHQRGGRLAPVVPVPGSQAANRVELSDVDADGDLDLVGSLHGPLEDGRVVSEVVVFLQRGGRFRPVRALAASDTHGYHDIAVGDVTGDGRPDLVAAAYDGIQIAEQRPGGGWRPLPMVVQKELGGIAVGDVTGDGRQDIVTGERSYFVEQRHVRVYAQGTDGRLAAPFAYRSLRDDNVLELEIADFDRDGRNDLVQATDSWHAAVALQQPDGRLGPLDVFPSGTGSRDAKYTSLAAGDFTDDGYPDLVRSEYDNTFHAQPQRTPRWPRRIWLRGSSIAQGQRGVSTGAAPVLRFARSLEPASVNASSVRLVRGDTGAVVPVAVAHDAAAGTVTVTPSAALEAGRPYAVRWGRVRDTSGAAPRGDAALRFTTAGEAADATPPDTGFLGGAPSVVTFQPPDFRAYATEPGTRTECAVDSGAFSPCTPLIEAPVLPAGLHTFRVRAVDAAGNADPTPAARTWRSDSSGSRPANDDRDDAKLIDGPSGRVTGTTVGADSDGYANDPPQLTGLSRGGASVWFRWVAPASGTVTFDTAGSGFDTILGVFSEGEPGGLRRLGDDDDQAGVKTSRVTVPVAAGRAVLVAVDGFGDGHAAAGGTFALSWSSTAGAPQAAPETTIDAGPADGAIAKFSSVRFHASRPGSRFECDRHDSHGWHPCSSPYLVPTGEGERSVSVRATGPTGATDATPAVRRWTSGLNGARAVVDVAGTDTGWLTVSPERSFALSADKPVSGFECRLDRGEWEACGPGVKVTGAQVGYHELDVFALSPGGRLQFEFPSGSSWTVMPSRSTSRPAGWSAPTAGVRADFDGDGWSDLAVPVPGEDLPDLTPSYGRPETDAGAVEVLYGSSSGFSRARTQRWTQASPGIAGDPLVSDAFGSAVAAGDFDGDGRADLAIGVPHDRAAWEQWVGGVVHVLYGAAGGLSANRSQTWNEGSPGIPGNPSEGGDFGSALAAGDADGDGDDDLAVGMPEEAIGLRPAAGSVHVIKGTPSGLTATGSRAWVQGSGGVPDASEGGDRFGDVLAFGDFDSDGRADLAVAAPGEDVGAVADAGAVTVLPGSATGPVAAGATRWTENTSGIDGAAEEGDGFGTALAAAPLDGTAGAELAIGTPAEDAGALADAGTVLVLPGRSGGLTATGSRVWAEGAGGLGGTREAGDRFGSALAAGDLGGTAHGELVVGAPDEDAGSVRDAGAVHVLAGSADGPAASGASVWSQSSAGVPDAVQPGDRFGASLATGAFGGTAARDLSVGVPGEAAPGAAGSGAGAGAIHLLFGASAGLTGEGAQYLDQDSPGVSDSGEGGDGFGAGGPSR